MLYDILIIGISINIIDIHIANFILNIFSALSAIVGLLVIMFSMYVMYNGIFFINFPPVHHQHQLHYLILHIKAHHYIVLSQAMYYIEYLISH